MLNILLYTRAGTWQGPAHSIQNRFFGCRFDFNCDSVILPYSIPFNYRDFSQYCNFYVLFFTLVHGNHQIGYNNWIMGTLKYKDIFLFYKIKF